MSSIPQNGNTCQGVWIIGPDGDELPEAIPVEWPVWDSRTDTPSATPLADLMSDPAAMDAEVMPYEQWVKLYGNGAALVEPRYIDIMEVAA